MNREIGQEHGWYEESTNTEVKISENGWNDMVKLEVDVQGFLQVLAIFGPLRMIRSGDRQGVDDPIFIRRVCDIELPEDSKKALKLSDLVTDLLRKDELVINWHNSDLFD